MRKYLVLLTSLYEGTEINVEDDTVVAESHADALLQVIKLHSDILVTDALLAVVIDDSEAKHHERTGKN